MELEPRISGSCYHLLNLAIGEIDEGYVGPDTIDDS